MLARLTDVYVRELQGFTGFGEVTPLPGLHHESLKNAEEQLLSVSHEIAGHVPPPGKLSVWLNRFGSLYPSVRTGVEMAALHLQARCFKVPIASLLLLEARQAGAPCAWRVATSHIRLNGLLDRATGTAKNSHGKEMVTILKVKVGGATVEEDVNRVNKLVSTMTSSRVRLRLDANQAWTLDQAATFLRGLKEPGVIEYIEEPLQNPREIPKLWKLCNGSVSFALDESLHDSIYDGMGLFDMEGLVAVVLKPTVLGGLDR